MGKQKGRELCLSWTLDLFPDGGIQPQVWEEPKGACRNKCDKHIPRFL